MSKTEQAINAVNHEDIDFFWDNNEETVGRSEDILTMMQRRMQNNGQQPQPEWSEDPEPAQKPRNQPRPSLFPKASVPKNPNGVGAENQSALSDSNALETLFKAPELRNSKTFIEIIEHNRAQKI